MGKEFREDKGKTMKRRLILPLCIFFAVTIVYAVPLLKDINNWGQMDWDQFTFWNAVPRQTILRYHQFPLWNPYGNGGNVLLAHPHSSFLSPFYILVLVFGPVIGLKLGIIAHLFIGMVGMFLLSRYFHLNKYSCYLPAFIYMLSSLFTLHLTEGHVEFLTMAFIPWLFLYYLKSTVNIRYVLGGIIALSLIILGGSMNVLSIGLFLLFVYSVFHALKKRKLSCLKVVVMIFMGSFLLSSIKLIPMLEFLNDNPRDTKLSVGIDATLLKNALLSTDQADYYEATKRDYQSRAVDGIKLEYGWHEYGAYVGYAALILALLGALFYSRRYWDLVITGILCLWITLGSGVSWGLWVLLHGLPFYDSLRVPSRFILGFVFCVSLLAGFGLSKLEGIGRKKFHRFLVVLIACAIFFELFMVNYPLLKNLFTIKPPEIKRHAEFKQRYRDFNILEGSVSSMYPVLLSNSGIINSYEVVSVKKGKVAIETEKDYKGEVYLRSLGTEIKPLLFSPNIIKLKLYLKQNDVLVINQNFYKGWKVQGIKSEVVPYNGLISIKLPAGKHDIVVYYLPKSFILGAVLSLITLIVLAFILWLIYNKAESLHD